MKKTYLALIIFVVVAAIIGLAGFLYYQNKNKTETPPTTTSEALPTQEEGTEGVTSQEGSPTEVSGLSQEEYAESYVQEQYVPRDDPNSTKIPDDFPDTLLYSGNYNFIEVDTTILGEGSTVPNRVIFFSYDKPGSVANYYFNLPNEGWTLEEKQEIPEQDSFYYVLSKNGTTGYINIDPSGEGTELIIRFY